MHKNSTYQYRFTDIEKYLKGELSPAEMHAMEKAALLDPFLADAIEGYQQNNLNRSSTHLSEIRNIILGTDEKTQVLPFIQSNLKWMRIAAILIIGAGMATIGWLLLNPDSKSTLADKKTLLKNKPKDSVVIFAAPSQTTVASSIKQQNVKGIQGDEKSKATVPVLIMNELDTTSELPSANTIKTSAQSALADIIAQQNQKKLITDSLNKLQLQSSTAKLSNAYSYAPSLQGKNAGVLVTNAKQPFLIKGQVLDSEQKPLSNATVMLNSPVGNTVKPVTTNIEGRFQLNSRDSSASVTVSSLGYEPIKSTLTSSSANLVTLTTQSNSLNEVVVTGYSIQKKKDLNAGAIKRIESKQGDSSSILPAGGMQEWIRAIQIKWETEKWDKRLLQGTIFCELTLNETGHVTDADFPEISNRRFKIRLTRLLKEGPVWLANSKPVKGRYLVRLPF